MKPLSYISKDNSKLSFTDRSLTLKKALQKCILRDLFQYMILWDGEDSSALELVSAKHPELKYWRYLICNGMMGFPDTLIKQSNPFVNLNDMSVKSQPKKYKLEDY